MITPNRVEISFLHSLVHFHVFLAKQILVKLFFHDFQGPTHTPQICVFVRKHSKPTRITSLANQLH